MRENSSIRTIRSQLVQFKAADQALQNAHFLLLDEVFRKSLALQLVEVLNACPGNCQDAERIEFLKKQFPPDLAPDRYDEHDVGYRGRARDAARADVWTVDVGDLEQQSVPDRRAPEIPVTLDLDRKIAERLEG